MPNIDLSVIKNPAQQRYFIEHLDSTLKRHSNNSTGRSYYDESGDHINESSIIINFNNTDDVLQLRITATDNDHLKLIEFQCPESPKTEEFAHSLITQSLVNTLGIATIKFFRRIQYCYIGEQLDGEYWIKNTRIAPVNPSDLSPSRCDVERYISLDMEVDAIDEQDAWSIANHKADKLIAKLSMITDTGLYKPKLEHRWFIPEDPNGPSELRQLGYFGHGPEISKMPRKGKVCNAGSFEGSMRSTMRCIGDSLKLPVETRKLLSAMETKSASQNSAFENSAFLYQFGLNAGRYSRTVKLSYFVASIDALCKAESIHNEFGKFLRHYAQPSHSIDHLINFMHGDVRSAHFHAGEFPFGEFRLKKPTTIFKSSIDKITDHRYDECHRIIRHAITNWAVLLINDATPTIKT
jgi:hypothetical protein